MRLQPVALVVNLAVLWLGYVPNVTLKLSPPSAELFDRGCELYTSRSDKEWSLTDCISFVVMKERGLTDALTPDRHFEQAGFKVLLSI